MILQNQARCLKCDDEPYSTYVHDFVSCDCSDIFVDGGNEYARHGFKDRETYEDMTILINDLAGYMAMSAIDWAVENKRNPFGILCAISRGLRDCGYEITEIKSGSS